jgi:hypothetical protein
VSILEQVGELRWAATYGAALYGAHPQGSIATRSPGHSCCSATTTTPSAGSAWHSAGRTAGALRADPDLAGLRGGTT